MADTLGASFRLTGDASVVADLPNRVAVESVQIGANGFPSLNTTYETGTGDGQANVYHVISDTVPGSGTLQIDLSGTNTDDLGNVITLTKVKELIVALDSPDGTKRVYLGPQDTSNAWQGPFGGVGPEAYAEVFHHQRFTNSYDGWTVTPGTADMLVLTNPDVADVDVSIIIIGLD